MTSTEAKSLSDLIWEYYSERSHGDFSKMLVAALEQNNLDLALKMLILDRLTEISDSLDLVRGDGLKTYEQNDA